MSHANHIRVGGLIKILSGGNWLKSQLCPAIAYILGQLICFYILGLQTRCILGLYTWLDYSGTLCWLVYLVCIHGLITQVVHFADHDLYTGLVYFGELYTCGSHTLHNHRKCSHTDDMKSMRVIYTWKKGPSRPFQR